MARPCLFKGGAREDKKRGIFHQWGNSFTYGAGDEKVPTTVAIVEDWDNGEVYEVDPAAVKFMPMPKDDDKSDEAAAFRKRMAISGA